MKIKNSILVLLLFFTLVPVTVFGLFSIYETNQKIDEMAQKNLKAVSENQIMNIQKFCGDRREEMEMVANYTLTQDAITRLFDGRGFFGGLVVVILLISLNKTVAGKSYIYPLIPFDPRECARRFLRIRVPHTYHEEK